MPEQSEELSEKEENFQMDEQGYLRRSDPVGNYMKFGFFTLNNIGVFLAVLAWEATRIFESEYWEDMLISVVALRLFLNAVPKAVIRSRQFYVVLAAALANFAIMEYYHIDNIVSMLIIMFLIIAKWEARKKNKNNHD